MQSILLFTYIVWTWQYARAEDPSVLNPFAPFTIWEKSRNASCDTFHGCLTMEDREVYLDPTSRDIPCGFMAPSDLDKVRSYFQKDYKCKIVVYTVIFGAWNYAYNPVSRDNYLIEDDSICFFLFIDEKTIWNGHGVIDLAPGHKNTPPWLHSAINGTKTWQFILIRDLNFKTRAHSTKIIKLSAPQVFPNADWLLYVDTKYVVANDPRNLIRYFKTQTSDNYSLGTFVKFYHSLQQEFRGARARVTFQSYQRFKHNDEVQVAEIHRQEKLYESEGLFKVYSHENKSCIIDAAVLIIRNDNRAKRYFCAWNNEVGMFSRRDQLAFYMVRHRHQMFPYRIWPKEMMGRVNHFIMDLRGTPEHPPQWDLFNVSNPHPFVLHPSTLP